MNALNLKPPISNSDLPKFYGDPSEYVPFSECFDYLVHNDDSIPDAMKAQYLKKCLPERTLDGKPNGAYHLLRLFIPNAENYKIMRKKLDDRYKICYLNKVTYLSNLRKLNTWRSCNSGSELRKLFDFVCENLELLNLAGGSSIGESDILLSDILAIIPKFIVNSFLELSEKDRNLDSLLGEIDKAASKMLERDVLVPRSNNPTNNNTNTSRYSSNSTNRNSHNRPSFTYFGQASDNNFCVFCTEGIV